MLNQNNNNPSVSLMQKSRMRYRGPIESLKINNFQQSMYRDIIRLGSELGICSKLLGQYAEETFTGSDKDCIIMKDGSEVFKCADNVPVKDILQS